MNAAATNKPRVTIVTVNRNDAAGLARTLDSVRAQTFRDFEHVVIDGASTDGSVDEIRARADGLAYWTSEPDGGIYAAMNKGWRRARGEYVNFLNSGDWLAAPDVLERVFAREPVSADVVYGDSLRPAGAGGFREVPQPENPTPGLFFLRWGVCHQTVFYRREMLAALGGYDERYRILGDWDFDVRALLAGRSWRHLPFPVAFYDAGGISANRPDWLAQERAWIRQRHLPPAVHRDYERWAFMEADCRRLRELERWIDHVRRRNVFVNFAMLAKWAWVRARNRRTEKREERSA